MDVVISFVLIPFIYVNMLSSCTIFLLSINKEDFILYSFIFFFSRLNLAKDTKLPTYPWEGSSHHVVQKIFVFFFFFVFFFSKRETQCVIVSITTNRTRELGLKGETGVQLLRHTRNCWHGVGLISLYWYTFKRRSVWGTSHWWGRSLHHHCWSTCELG